jgi:hypothetical protein
MSDAMCLQGNQNVPGLEGRSHDLRHPSPPVVIASPVKKRGKRNENTTDAEMWNRNNEEIIGMLRSPSRHFSRAKVLAAESRRRWKSPVHDHYDVVVKRHTRPNGDPDYIEFHFTCKVDPRGHNVHVRKQMQTGHGTSNLARDIEECNSCRGVDSKTAAGAQQTVERSISEYTPAKHCAIIDNSSESLSVPALRLSLLLWTASRSTLPLPS